MSQSVKQEYVRSAGIWICSLYTQGGQQQHQQDYKGKQGLKLNKCRRYFIYGWKQDADYFYSPSVSTSVNLCVNIMWDHKS